MPAAPSNDIITLIRDDHQLVKRRLSDVPGAPTDLKASEFWELTQQLVRHEVAEEVVVYPALRELPGGDAVADSCIAEQSEAEELLAEMEDMDATSDAFDTALRKLTEAVLSHAEHEEKDVLTLLGEKDSSAHLAELGERYQVAKNSAPTHPHPNAPDTPPGNKVMGPITAVIDRMRDEIRSVA